MRIHVVFRQETWIAQADRGNEDLVHSLNPQALRVRVGLSLLTNEVKGWESKVEP